MSDKSFGDCPSRNIVKNPLLSTAVTGLSIEDLTHNAVLIPVAATQGLITGSEHQIGSNNHTLGHSEHDFTNFPSGDSNTNVFAPQTTVSAHPLPVDNQQLLHSEKKSEKMVPSLSKASLNTEDDFDVNEYFARLHGTRYVSAPINSNPDENANLAAEDNLEEINLNDDKVAEPQQSLTADIAQNFSQLPTVLPHVASAVFSSFSNMLNYKSREQTPDDRQQDSLQPGPGPVGSGFVGQNLSVDTSQVAEEVAKDVAPPPKEMGSAGASSFRITSKKRYAQIPGLSSGTNFETLQKIELNPLTKNVTNYFVPSYEEKAEEPVGTPSQTIEAPKHDTYDIFSPKPEANPSDFQSNAFNISMDNDSKSFEERLPPPTSYATQGNATIPPPPMFSSQRTSSQSAKSVLPPSVARRIGSNHPVIKPQTVQTFHTENIFVPTFDPMAFSNEPAQPIGSSFGETPSQSFDSQIVTQQPTSHSQDAALANVPSIPPPAQFTQPTSAFTAPLEGPPTQLPSQTLPPPPSNIPTNLPAPPMFAPTQPPSSSIFAPPKLEDKSKSAKESVPPNIFAPTPPTQVPPGPIKPPTIGPTPNIGPPTFFTPPPVESAPIFYSTDNKQVQPSQQYVSEPPKPLVEPPKATGAVNYRLNKKRPQYYSGPIEGVGSISNSIKPIIAPVDPVTFHGAMFTPQPPADLNVPSSIPFDLSKPAENEPLVPPDSAQNLINAPTPVFDISQTAPYQHFDITKPEPNTALYNTAFDLSRPTTENYEPVEQKESKGFGIIGSLKSKLSSIDINKIQHSVTTFFDPAYNDTTKQDFSAQQNVPYANNPYQAQTAQTNLEIFVPGPQQNIQQYPYDYQHQSLYSNSEYYRYPNFQNQGQPAAGHCSNEHHYPSHSQHPKAYDNSQHGYGNQPMNSMFHSSNLHTHGDNVMTVEPTNVNNSNVMTYKETQDFNAEREMDENVARAGPEVSRLLQSTTSIEERFATNFFHNKYATAAEPIKQTDETPHNIPPIGQDRTTKDSFEPIKQDAQVAEPVAMFNPDTVNLFANLQIDSKDDIKQADKTPHNIPPIGQDRMFTKDSFEPIKPDAQVSEPVAMFNPNTVNLFGNLKIDSKGDIKQADKTPHNIPPIGQDRTVTKESFEPIKQNVQVAEPVAMFNPNTVNLFANLKIDSKDDSNEKTKNTFTTQSFKGEEKQDISTNEAQSVDLFANIKTDSEEKESKLFPAMDIKASVQSFKEDTKPQNLFPFEKKEISSSKDNLLDSLTKDDGMILGVSSVPLFGLSPMVVEQPKDSVGSEMIGSLPERNASTSFFEHSQKLEDYGAKHADALNPNASFSFFENISAPIKDETQELVTDVKMTIFFDNSNVIGQIVKDETLERKENIEKDITADIPSTTQEDDENASELSICETCREVNKPEDKDEDQDVTSQLIENITAPIQLSNPVEATLTETPVLEPVSTDQETFNAGQFEEISHITEETIETIQVQSAIELLDDVGEVNPMNYGWNESALKGDYNFNVDTNQIGFFGKSSLFFDKGAATEEIENEKNKLVRQMSVPSAPPAEEEEDSKSDETGILDVNSIEQDAKKDFPLFEEFVIEPSENDDDNFNEQERSEGVLDSFTDRIEKYKSLEPSECGDPLGSSFFPMPHPIGMSSYFDTGNYAVEAHYRNTNTRPAPALSIPPGFEEEYKRRLALAKQREENLRKEMVVVPDTSTQTKTTSVATYCASRIASSYNCPPPPVGFNIETNLSNLVKDEDEIAPENLSPAISQNVLTAGDDKPPERSNDNETKLPEFVNVFGLKPVEDFDDKKEKELSIDVSKTSEEQKVLPTFQAFGASKPNTEEKPEEKLLDPINFFSDTTTTNPPESFSRLASYFSSPPKTDHAKSFFELSQSQNHYRHATSEQKSKINDLIKDLTSVQNISPSQDQIIKHVNYFTVEYDTVLSEFKHGEVFGKESADLNEDVNLDRDFTNCRYCTEIVNTSFTVKTAINTTSDQGTSTAPNNNDMESQNKAARGSVTVSFDGVTVQEDNNLGILSEAENRSATEYSPVLHHWFYRVDVEDKSIWRGFSVQDSRALENAFLNPNLTENTMVATDGGRYDVNIVSRLRIPVYWTDKPTNVRRCSWFYKGTTDARYVPYTEAVAEKLEEEYRHGMTTAEWHRRLVLPNGEVVVMHGPSVMVHFLHSENAFSTPPQSSSRPRVVRRGHDESEIEDTEPSSIDHLLLLCHGVGSACDMRFRSVEEVVEDFRTTSLQLIQSHYRNSYDQGIVSRVEVLPISWHATLHSGETGVDRRLSQITLNSIPRLRSFTNETVLDVLFYTSPVFCQTILDTVCKELNRIYELFLQRNPDFKGGISLGGHSLGSVILYDLLCHQNEISPEESRHKSDKNYVHGPAGTGQPAVRYPQLHFAPAALYALGSPIAIFECIRGVESLGASFSLPTCKNFFNIFHPYDPIAYRIEPLINPVLRDLKPSLIPHHKGRKRMHLELKDTMARVGADLKQKLLESLRSTWNKWKTQPTEGQLEKVVEEELEKEQLTDDSREEMARERELSTPEKLGRLNGGRRIDYVLQEAPLEMINEYLFAMSSHVGYWESEDTMLLILREVYSALGVQPDSTVPQQNMTVQRTRPVKPDETIIINNTDTPSTSRGPI